MLEPIVALGLAANVLQIVGLGWQITTCVKALHASAEGITVQLGEIETVSKNMQRACETLSHDADNAETPDVSKDGHFEDLVKKCLDVATEIRGIVDKIRMNTSGWKRIQVVRSAVTAAMKEHTIKSLQDRLTNIRIQICVHVLTELQKNDSAFARKLAELGDANRRMHISTQTDIAAFRSTAVTALEGVQQCLRAMVEVTNHHFQSQQTTACDALLRLAQEGSDLEKAQQVLRDLDFPEIHHRRAQIREQFPETFSWIFQNSNQSHFRQWLQRRDGLFWLRGRAGSGKSTLMKYIINEPRTTELLRNWANSIRKSLVTADFFFWFAGTDIQKSREGLLRSLLLQILRQNHRLIPDVLPHRWEQAGKNLSPGFQPEFWEEKELYEALHKVATVESDCCYCFFIDGLDEFEAKPGDDYDIYELAKEIKALTESLPSFKICASSRPWDPFQHTFLVDAASTLKLEDLTRQDIDRFVREKFKQSGYSLSTNPGDDGQNLVEKILDQAKGVFLWVTLVVNSLISGLKGNDDAYIMQQRLEELPPNLKGFFRRMLNATPSIYRPYEARLLRMASHAATLPLITANWIIEEQKNPDYAVEGSVSNPGDPERADKMKAKLARAERCVGEWCKDLLEVCPQEDEPAPGDTSQGKIITFMHRTARDFVNGEEVQDHIKRIIGNTDFHPSLAMCRLWLAEAKTSGADFLDSDSRARFEKIVDELLYHAKIYEQLKGVNANLLLLPILEALNKTGNILSGPSGQPCWIRFRQISRHGSALAHRRYTTNKDGTALTLAVCADLVYTVQAWIDKYGLGSETRNGRRILDFALFPTLAGRTLRNYLKTTTTSPEMIQLLLSKGTPINANAGSNQSVTVWQMFLLDRYAQSLHSDPAHVPSIRRPPDAEQLWEIARLLLRKGADPSCKVTIRFERAEGKLRRKREMVSVVDCLSRVASRREEVEEFLSTLPRTQHAFARK